MPHGYYLLKGTDKDRVMAETGTLDTLQTRYRPDSWDGVIGQEATLKTLRGIVKRQAYNYTRSYIFAGSPGSGKTTTGRILANAIICDHPDTATRPCHQCQSCRQFSASQYADYIEVDAGQYNKVEDVKKLIDIAKVYPIHSTKHRIILIDEAHRLSRAAWDSMLKLLEEGNIRTIFMFATTEGHNIPPAIHSRSIAFNIKPLSVAEIMRELKRVCDAEGVAYDRKSLESIAYANRGKMRDALKTLDMHYRAQGDCTGVTLQTPEETFCEILKLAFFNKTQEASELLDTLAVNGDKLGDTLCATITAIYTHPHQTTSSIPETTLNSTKNLLGKELRRVITEFMTLKPQTYEQVKLFLFILAEAGIPANPEVQAHQGKRRLFAKTEEEEPADGDDDDF